MVYSGDVFEYVVSVCGPRGPDFVGHGLLGFGVDRGSCTSKDAWRFHDTVVRVMPAVGSPAINTDEHISSADASVYVKDVACLITNLPMLISWQSSITFMPSPQSCHDVLFAGTNGAMMYSSQGGMATLYVGRRLSRWNEKMIAWQ